MLICKTRVKFGNRSHSGPDCGLVLWLWAQVWVLSLGLCPRYAERAGGRWFGLGALPVGSLSSGPPHAMALGGDASP